MAGSELNFSFPHRWHAEILPGRPAILPARHFVYPHDVEEVERGALEVLVRPEGQSGATFLATCALGFRDPMAPTGIWSMPNPQEMCAVSGGYAYVIDTSSPERFTMVPFRPVLNVLPATGANLLLFVDHRSILAWGKDGGAWHSPKLSDEGVTITDIQGGTLHGAGWSMMADKDTLFTLDLRTGVLMES
jgi:hypothetical protein